MFPGDIVFGAEVDHSSPFGVEVENKWSYTSASPICVYVVGGDKFTFYVSRLCNEVTHLMANTIFKSCQNTLSSVTFPLFCPKRYNQGNHKEMSAESDIWETVVTELPIVYHSLVTR